MMLHIGAPELFDVAWRSAVEAVELLSASQFSPRSIT